jgi:hypothetical protein
MGQDAASRQLLYHSEPGCRYSGRFYKDGEKRVGFWGSCEKCTLVCCDRDWLKDKCSREGNPVPECDRPAGATGPEKWPTGTSRVGDSKGTLMWCCFGKWESKPCARAYLHVSDDQKTLNGMTVQG